MLVLNLTLLHLYAREEKPCSPFPPELDFPLPLKQSKQQLI